MDSQIHDGISYNPATTTGLTFGFKGGYNPERITENQVTAGTIGLTDNDTNYVFVNGSTVGVTVSPIVGGQFLYEIVTSAGVISSITDRRGTLE